MIKLTVKSPDKNIFDNNNFVVQEIIIDTESGLIGIKDGHENLISAITNGEMKIIPDTQSDVKEMIFAISSGILKIDKTYKDNIIITNVDILLQEAQNIDNLNIEETEKAIQRAKELSLESNQEDQLFINEQLLRNLNKIKVARKYKI